MEINVKNIFDSIEDLEYVVLRGKDDIFQLQEGADIDILVMDTAEVVKRLLAHLSTYAKSGYEIKKEEIYPHIHIDIMKDTTLILRIDILYVLPFSLPSNVIIHTLLTRKKKDNYYVPSTDMEIFTRLLEYFERPEKLRHLEYVRNLCKD